MTPDAVAKSHPTVALALREASDATGVGFDYLLKTAMRESALEPEAKARGSSASGLFQFIESTWLEMVKAAGSKFGLGNYADQIERGSNGHYRVADAGARREILALRDDPRASALMAAEFTRRNAEELESGIGRAPTGDELYMAHFLGAGDARRLIALAESDPSASAVEAFPRAARVNRSIFYHRGGGERSMGEVYDLLGKHGDSTPVVEATATKLESKVASFFAALFRFSGDEGEGGEAKKAEKPAPSLASLETGRADEPAARQKRAARRAISAPLELQPGGGERPITTAAPQPAAQAAWQGGDPSMPDYVAPQSAGAGRSLQAHHAYGHQNSWLAALGERLGLIFSA